MYIYQFESNTTIALHTTQHIKLKTFYCLIHNTSVINEIQSSNVIKLKEDNLKPGLSFSQINFNKHTINKKQEKNAISFYKGRG